MKNRRRKERDDKVATLKADHEKFKKAALEGATIAQLARDNAKNLREMAVAGIPPEIRTMLFEAADQLEGYAEAAGWLAEYAERRSRNEV